MECVFLCNIMSVSLPGRLFSYELDLLRPDFAKYRHREIWVSRWPAALQLDGVVKKYQSDGVILIESLVSIFGSKFFTQFQIYHVLNFDLWNCYPCHQNHHVHYSWLILELILSIGCLNWGYAVCLKTCVSIYVRGVFMRLTVICPQYRCVCNERYG